MIRVDVIEALVELVDAASEHFVEGCSWPTSPASDSIGQRPRVRLRGVDDDPRA